MPGVEVVAVANRSLESSRRAAAEFEHSARLRGLGAVDGRRRHRRRAHRHVAHMHRSITVAALESGRHVLCQARMANNAAEAHEMLAASRRHPNLVCQLVPSSSGYSIDIALRRLLADRVVGDVLSVEVQRLERAFAEFGGEFDWRHNPEFSGYNVLNVGAIYESMMRWLVLDQRLSVARLDRPGRRQAGRAKRRRDPLSRAELGVVGVIALCPPAAAPASAPTPAAARILDRPAARISYSLLSPESTCGPLHG